MKKFLVLFILIIAIVVTAVIVINKDNNKGESEIPFIDYETLSNPVPLTNEDMYQGLIDQYESVMSEFNIEDFEAAEELYSRFPLVSSSLIEHVARYAAEGVTLTYDYYDIDKNGTDELIVGANGAYGAIYSYDKATKQPVKIFFQDTLERGSLNVLPNGTIFSEGSGGAALHYYEFGKIDEAGTAYKLLESIEEEYLNENDPPVYKDAKTGEELSYNNLDEIMAKYN